MYGFRSTSDYADKALMSPENLMMADEYNNFHNYHNMAMNTPMFGSDDVQLSSDAANSFSLTTPQNNNIYQIRYGNCGSGSGSRKDDNNNNNEDYEEDGSNIIKAKIVSHPYYPKLLDAYIDCQKVNYSLALLLSFCVSHETRIHDLSFYEFIVLSLLKTKYLH